MKRLLVLACGALFCLSATALAQDAPKKVDVTGAWELTMEGPQGSMAFTATFKQDGEKLTGTQSNPMGGEDKLEGTVKGAKIDYVIKIDMGGQAMSIAFSATVDGDTLKGTVTMGEMGSSTFSGKRKG
jgi:hypothetical protein